MIDAHLAGVFALSLKRIRGLLCRLRARHCADNLEAVLKMDRTTTWCQSTSINPSRVIPSRMQKPANTTAYSSSSPQSQHGPKVAKCSQNAAYSSAGYSLIKSATPFLDQALRLRRRMDNKARKQAEDLSKDHGSNGGIEMAKMDISTTISI